MVCPEHENEEVTHINSDVSVSNFKRHFKRDFRTFESLFTVTLHHGNLHKGFRLRPLPSKFYSSSAHLLHILLVDLKGALSGLWAKRFEVFTQKIKISITSEIMFSHHNCVYEWVMLPRELSSHENSPQTRCFPQTSFPKCACVVLPQPFSQSQKLHSPVVFLFREEGGLILTTKISCGFCKSACRFLQVRGGVNPHNQNPQIHAWVLQIFVWVSKLREG